MAKINFHITHELQNNAISVYICDINEVNSINLDRSKSKKTHGEAFLTHDGNNDCIIVNIDSKKIIQEENDLTDNLESGAVFFQHLGGKISDLMKKNNNKDCIIHFKAANDEQFLPYQPYSNLVFGVGQKMYKFTTYITDQEKKEYHESEKNIYLHFPKDYFNDNIINAIKKKILDNSILLDSIHSVRDLVNEPANVLYPESYKNIVKGEIEKLQNSGIKNISIEILNKKELEKLNANLLLSVAQGSRKEPYVVIIKYIGNEGKQDEKGSYGFDLALIGKGVTFDTGGNSIKPANGMEDMKGDMAGSATAFQSIVSIARQRLPLNVICYMGLVENMCDGNAQRPGDIWRSMSSKTVEVLNTDAEGRLVLADLLTHCQNNNRCDYILDFATLTGAILIALGEEMCGFFTNSKKLSNIVNDASFQSGDLCWQMPITKHYQAMLDSNIADLKNISGTGHAGSVTAAVFLSKFINKDQKWCHFDIAGTSDSSKDKALHIAGPSGFGVKLVNQICHNIIDK